MKSSGHISKLFTPSRRTAEHFRASNFTLIELLVVIVIIAILAAMLLPALNKARERAKMVKCMAHLKQVSLATLQYSDDNKGWVPPIYSDNYPYAIRWWGGGGNGPGAALLVTLNYLPGNGKKTPTDPTATINFEMLNCPVNLKYGYATTLFWHMGGTNTASAATSLRRFPLDRYKQCLFGDLITLTSRNHDQNSNWAWPDGSVSSRKGNPLPYNRTVAGSTYFYPVYLNF